ncbi:bifunctional helix-turn-helix domain-containing protein/methylated-DNA--[protein]-cysteine S-methyltransferase [Shimia ponticola]|uniref:bifunctional helix-turn-helix domain-containing protein/methylated-DNA--[protein]-cysteine S-methyltransferase n=1 Tax=Shimia ponticola TaxID=2582893 RepID=UPI0011BDE699|nr:bifunctional helix-turn-helix domain-containing protein/methylated-DNA--[protein]-cysteine S-methyltransferase [Shimia ponticola]
MDMEHSYHYGVIRRAIEAIDAAEGPVSLDALAAEAGMSPAHFQRTFSSWAGVSPKRYQQFLTLGHAKSLLKERFTTLETAGAVGLSGTSRLHDLFIRWEAMSPGEFAKGGAGTTISYGWFQSPFGEALAMGTDRGICGLAFADETGRKAAMEDMRGRWPNASYREDPDMIRDDVHAAFGGGETRVLLIGAPLQIKVWEALMQIPSGQVTTYSEIAHRVGAPRAVRAVGTAVGRNPVSWIVPCHRALRKSGGLGGYHWGLAVKRAMLAYEAAQTEGTDGLEEAMG